MKLLICFAVSIGIAIFVLGKMVSGLTIASSDLQTCFVPGNYATIQAAVDEPTCSDIWLQTGTYTETVTINHTLSIHGQGQDLTMIHPDANDSAVIIEAGIVVSLTNLAIRNGYALYGGAINIDHSNLNLANVTIANNQARDAGGGIYNNGGSVVVENSLLIGNFGSAANGGAIYTTNGGSILVSYSSLVENGVSASSHDGGAIYNDGSSIQILFSDILSNTSSNQGGAIYNDSGTIYVSNSRLRANSASSGGATVNRTYMTLTESEFTDNNAYSSGAAVLNIGTLTVEGCLFERNYADLRGGGITNFASLNVTDSHFNENSSTYEGGAIQNEKWFYNIAPITSIASSFLVNNRSASGGAIMNGGGARLTIDYSTFLGNSAQSGGAIMNWENSTYGKGITTINNSALVKNVASGAGGALNNAGDIIINDSTISGNSSVEGGGIRSYYLGSMAIYGSTVAYNVSTLHGGGIVNYWGNVELANTIVANNSPGGDCWIQYENSYHSLGHNLDSDGTCLLTNNGDIANSYPRLSPLHGFNETSLYHALLAGSPAIDAGDDSACSFTDQRGALRPFDGDGDSISRCDIGAFEFDETLPVSHFSVVSRISEPLEMIEYTDLSTGEYSSTLWDFGDGVTSNLPNPTHMYTVTGTYTITLTIEGPHNSDSVAYPGYIWILPEVYRSMLPVVAKP